MRSTGRPLCAGDILILVRSRTELASLIVARLYAQKVPVAGIDRSAYYRDKFEGLTEQFGAGCVVLQADDPLFARKLSETFDELWRGAEALKPKLLSAAEEQIRSAHAAYHALPGLIA